MADVNPVSIPMDLNIKLVPNPDNNEPNHSNSYVRLWGVYNSWKIPKDWISAILLTN